RVRRRGGLGALERAQQVPGGDAAVDHVLAVVARVVPAAPHVQPVVADTGLAGHVGVALVGRYAHVAGRPGVLLADQIAVDLDAAALDVEELHRVRAQLVVDVAADRERVAGLPVGAHRVAGARRGDVAEVQRVHVLAGGRVHPAGGGHALGHGGAAGVDQGPRQRVG